MIKDALQWLASQRADHDLEMVVAGEERMFINREIFSEVTPAVIHPQTISTLAGLVEFVKLPEISEVEGLFVEVELSAEIRVWGALNPVLGERMCFARLAPPSPHGVTGLSDESQWDGWFSSDDLIPAIMCGFTDGADKADVLKLIGNVRAGAEQTLVDDGVTQMVSAKAGITKKGLAEIPNPVTLIPRSAYSEIEHAAQQYVLRARGGSEEGPPKWRLFRVADPFYETERAALIRDYLEQALPNVAVI